MPLDRPKMIDGIEAWKVENAAEALTRAKEIEQDAKLHKAAIRFIDKKIIVERQVKLDAARAAAPNPSKKKEPTVSIQA